MEENKKSYWFYVLGVLALIALGAAIWYGAYIKNKTNLGPEVSINLEEALKYVPSVKPVVPGQLPENWPSDVPLFGKIKITQSQNQVSPGSTNKVEASMVFLSSQKISNLFNNYRNWAIKNKWALKSGGSSPTSGSLNVSLGGQSALFNFSSTNDPNQTVVSIYYVSK